MVAGREGEGYVVVVGSLQGISGRHAYLAGGGIHPRVHDAGRLHQDDLLQELDAAHADSRGGGIHAAQDVRFDGSHELPVLRIAGVGDTGARSSIRESSGPATSARGHGGGVDKATRMFAKGMLSGDGGALTYVCRRAGRRWRPPALRS